VGNEVRRLRERRRITLGHAVEHGRRDPGSRRQPLIDKPFSLTYPRTWRDRADPLKEQRRWA
jgi:hypothetical protein